MIGEVFALNLVLAGLAIVTARAGSMTITLTTLSYAAALWLVERRRRKSWLVHLAAGVQYLCITFILSALVYGGGRLAGVDVAAVPVVGVAMIGVLALYVVLLLRRLYGDGWGAVVHDVAPGRVGQHGVVGANPLGDRLVGHPGQA